MGPARVPPTDEPDEPVAPTGTLLPVAGIGASAGGLAATTELLRHLGARPGVWPQPRNSCSTWGRAPASRWW